MAGGAGNNDEETISGINVTPLVDVVLVLLIILMVTAQYAAEKDSIPMDL
ncbi:MAG TPA: biopolymer transporter ExbD, partial [Polyangiales bacterium]